MKDNTHSDLIETEHTLVFSPTSLQNESPLFNKSTHTPISSLSNSTKHKVFQVIHKKEIIKNDVNGIPQLPLIKCVYCGNKYFNIHRFEAHIRIHVSVFLIFLFF